MDVSAQNYGEMEEEDETDSRKASMARMTGWVLSLFTIRIDFGG